MAEKLALCATGVNYTAQAACTVRIINLTSGSMLRMTALTLYLLLVALLVVRPARAADPLPPGFDPARHMRVSEVRSGMTGYGLTVFRGTKAERFDVEVVSVLRNYFNPKQDVVLVRLKGRNLEHSGAVQGMSGAPIFLKDEQGRERMIGAFAYGWQAMKDPVGGVQTIEAMLRLPASPTGAAGNAGTGTRPAAPGKVSWSLSEVIPLPSSTSTPAGYPFASRDDDSVNSLRLRQEDLSRLRPLTTPLMTSGISPRVLEQFGPVLATYGFRAFQAAGGSSPIADADAKIEPGSSLAVPMLRGDMDITALGTCTEVLPDRVLGFGHAFMSEGEVSLPMGAGYVHDVISGLVTSFKLGSVTRILGTVYADEMAGIAGRFGPAPAMVPIQVRCVYEDGSFDSTYRMEAAQHPQFLPILAAVATANAVSSARDLPQQHTLTYTVDMKFANGQTLHVENISANANLADLFQTVGAPIQAAMENPFERVALQSYSATVKVASEARAAEVMSVSVPRSKYRPGETLKLFVRYRPFRGAEAVLPAEFELPHDLPDGQYEFSVADWRQYMSDEQTARPFRFTAQSAAEVFEVLRDFTATRRDAIYLRLVRQPDGVAIGRTAMPRLPSSRRQVMMGAGLSNTTAFVSASVKAIPTGHVMSGSAQFTITVDRAAAVDTAGRPAKPDANPSHKGDEGKPRLKPAAPGKLEVPAANDAEKTEG